MKKNKVYILIEKWYSMENGNLALTYSEASNIAYHNIEDAIKDAKGVIKQCVKNGEEDFSTIVENDYGAVYVQKNLNVSESYKGYKPIKRKLIVKEMKFL